MERDGVNGEIVGKKIIENRAERGCGFENQSEQTCPN